MAQAQAAAPSREDFAQMLEESFGEGHQEGSVVKGTVVGIEKDLAVIDVGAKTLIDAKAPAENAFASTAPMLERPARPASSKPPAPAKPASARPVPIAAVDPFGSSASDDVDLSVVKPKSSKGVVFGVLAEWWGAGTAVAVAGVVGSAAAAALRWGPSLRRSPGPVAGTSKGRGGVDPGRALSDQPEDQASAEYSAG